MARIDYCNSLLYGVPAVHLSKLQRVQNSAARLISYTPRYHHISSVLFELHWLPIKYRIPYKVVVTAFKVIHSLAPVYLGSLMNIRACTITCDLLMEYFCMNRQQSSSEHLETGLLQQPPLRRGTLYQLVLGIKPI